MGTRETDPDGAIAAGIELLEGGWTAFFADWKDARAGKASAVHHLRVSIRRLRAALEILSSLADESSIPRLRRALRKLLRKMGPLRDMQVQRSIARRAELSPALGGFRKHVEQRERAEVMHVRRTLAPAMRRKLQSRRRTIRKDLGSKPSGFTAVEVRAAVLHVVRKRTGRMRLASADLKVDDMQTVHALRIAYKNLRYTIEAAKAVLPGVRIDTAAGLRKRQRELGQIRDMELVRKHMSAWAEGRPGPERRRIGAICRKMERQVMSRLEGFRRLPHA